MARNESIQALSQENPNTGTISSRHYQKLVDIHQSGWHSSILPSPGILESAKSSLKDQLPHPGLGEQNTVEHLFSDIIPALNGSSLHPRYYGFVTGGSTPIALLADNIVSTYDQNVQVHLQNDTVATDVEAKALDWLQDLLHFNRIDFPAKTFTTGATASNVLGLACGREFVLRRAAERKGISGVNCGENGILAACTAAGVSSIQILTTMPHSSLSKAAGILGLGRDAVKSIALKDDPLKLDLDLLRQEASKPLTASILAISCGEVNTGHFATSSMSEMRAVRKICDDLDIWIHVDGAFGLFGRILDSTEPAFKAITSGCEGLELADSITGDGHKFLNVPYDCGFFFSRSVEVSQSVFLNPNAAYLGAAVSSIPSPLNIGIENSRRFRALPVYASLRTYGLAGYRAILEEQIALARAIVGFLHDHDAYEVLPNSATKEVAMQRTYVIVLFRAKSEQLNDVLASEISYGEESGGDMYVSGTAWEGKKATRIAVSNWRVDRVRDFGIVKSVLEKVARASK